jgi:hypothetical protein
MRFAFPNLGGTDHDSIQKVLSCGRHPGGSRARFKLRKVVQLSDKPEYHTDDQVLKSACCRSGAEEPERRVRRNRLEVPVESEDLRLRSDRLGAIIALGIPL